MLDHQHRLSVLSLASTGRTVSPRLVAFAIGPGAGSSRAFEWALNNLFLADDTVVLLHAWGGGFFSGSKRAAGARLMSRYEHLLNERGFKSYRMHLAKGNAVGVICDAVRGHGCDMCIVGGSLPGLPDTLKTAMFGSVRPRRMSSPGLSPAPLFPHFESVYLCCGGKTLSYAQALDQVSLDVAQACSCPVVVLKTGLGAGALLKVVPRRVFVYTRPRIDERTDDSDSYSFDWALAKLINPETDEVYLVRDKGSVLMDGWRGDCDSMDDAEAVASMDAERAATDAHVDACFAALQAIGVRTIHRVRNVDRTPASLLAMATANSCDLLVCSRNAPGLYNNAPFPVVVIAPTVETKAAAQLEPPAMLQFWGGRVENALSSSCDSSMALGGWEASSMALGGWEAMVGTPTVLSNASDLGDCQEGARSSHFFDDEGDELSRTATSLQRELSDVCEPQDGSASIRESGRGGGRERERERESEREREREKECVSDVNLGPGSLLDVSLGEREGRGARRLSGGGGIPQSGGMSRSSSRRNLQLDDCGCLGSLAEGMSSESPEAHNDCTEEGLSSADTVRAACCSEWERSERDCSEWERSERDCSERGLGDLELPPPAFEPMPFERTLLSMQA